ARLSQGGRRAREGEQVVQQDADALDLRQREIAERGAELLVVEAFGEELDEGADGDERIADLVRDAGRERAEGREPVGTSAQLALELGVREQRRRAVDEPTGERARGRRQRSATGQSEERLADGAPTRVHGQNAAPGRGGRIERRRVNGTPSGDRNLRTAGGRLEEERSLLEPERTGEQLEERAGRRRLSAALPPPAPPAGG